MLENVFRLHYWRRGQNKLEYLLLASFPARLNTLRAYPRETRLKLVESDERSSLFFFWKKRKKFYWHPNREHPFPVLPAEPVFDSFDRFRRIFPSRFRRTCRRRRRPSPSKSSAIRSERLICVRRSTDEIPTRRPDINVIKLFTAVSYEFS
jgi:hypothetical protein